MASHALLSASSAHRWLHCPPSAQMERGYKDTSSVFAEEGTLAHAISEVNLRAFAGEITEAVKEDELNELRRLDLYFPAMEEDVLPYIETCMEHYLALKESDKETLLLIEERLDYSHIAPKGFGTGDCVIIGGETLEIIDLKYGKGVEVSPVNNPQLMLYGLGALHAYGFLYNIKSIKLTIAQVRLGNIDTFEIDTDDLIAWGESIKPIAQLAYEGKGEEQAGDWCKFCKHRKACMTRAKTHEETYETYRHKELTDSDYERLLPLLGDMESFIKDVKEEATARLLQGQTIAGYKVVAGRSIRKITDPERLAERLMEEGYLGSQIYKPRELQTITNLEKLTGKAVFKALSKDCVAKPEGQPTLAKATDKRPAIAGIESDYTFTE